MEPSGEKQLRSTLARQWSRHMVASFAALTLLWGIVVPSAHGGAGRIQSVPYAIDFMIPPDSAPATLLGSTMIQQFNPAFGRLLDVTFIADRQLVGEVATVSTLMSSMLDLTFGATRTDTVPGGPLVTMGTFTDMRTVGPGATPVEVSFVVNSPTTSIFDPLMPYQGIGTFEMTSMLEAHAVESTACATTPGCSIGPAGFTEPSGGGMLEALIAAPPSLSVRGTLTYIFAPRSSSPGEPIFPDIIDPDGDGFTFISPNPGFWFDPPLVDGFTYTLFGGAEFTQVGIPPGFNDIHVIVGGVDVATLDAGDFFDFPTPVAMFSLTGILPLVDAEDPTAFPTFLDFTGPASRLTMAAIVPSAAVPEPSTWLLLATGLVGLLGYGWRRRQRVP